MLKRITVTEVSRRWGDEGTAAEKVRKRRLAWLAGHVGIPKSVCCLVRLMLILKGGGEM